MSLPAPSRCTTPVEEGRSAYEDHPLPEEATVVTAEPFSVPEVSQVQREGLRDHLRRRQSFSVLEERSHPL